MDNTADFELLVGKEVTQAFALHDLEYGWLQRVIFQVDGMQLLVSVNPDTDEIAAFILPEIDFLALEQQFSFTQISNQRKRISRIWRMTNQLGYEDGLQLEFDDMEGTNVQLLAEASQLKFTIFRRYTW
ncbi:DUF6334 domain-containing protein [Pontibacter korlensis]|uniref:Uncharacterized protein n=1 Tax=Pontibacter korlensis TaxID=400092 RepID=A0A0E3UV46_9BACT|nr:DUF6334 family protein [Pontibacter korlensis]AKD02202.1 hypothetical protein PKOR_02470 [Pontibacter korlensis]